MFKLVCTAKEIIRGGVVFDPVGKLFRNFWLGKKEVRCNSRVTQPVVNKISYQGCGKPFYEKRSCYVPQQCLVEIYPCQSWCSVCRTQLKMTPLGRGRSTYHSFTCFWAQTAHIFLGENVPVFSLLEGLYRKSMDEMSCNDPKSCWQLLNAPCYLYTKA